jgi:hypothetical protein
MYFVPLTKRQIKARRILAVEALSTLHSDVKPGFAKALADGTLSPTVSSERVP